MVIGQGNVSLDITRILLSDVDALRKTDLSEKALEVFSRSKIRNIDIVGRRSLLQVMEYSSRQDIYFGVSVDFRYLNIGFFH